MDKGSMSVHLPTCVTIKRLYSFRDAERSEILRSHLFLLSLFWGVFQLHTSRLLLQVWKLHQKSWTQGKWGGAANMTWLKSSPYSLGDIPLEPPWTGAGPEPDWWHCRCNLS